MPEVSNLLMVTLDGPHLSCSAGPRIPDWLYDRVILYRMPDVWEEPQAQMTSAARSSETRSSL